MRINWSIVRATQSRIQVGLGVCVVAAMALTGAACAEASASASARSPEQIYDTNCGYCHGHNVGPIIKGRELPAEAIAYFVRNGNGAMPSFKQTEISPSELAALAEWISTSPADIEEHGQ